MRNALVLFAALALTASAFSAEAAACRDAKGKFMKCPTPAAATVAAKTTATQSKPKAGKSAMAAVRCRNASGAFAKCGTPGASAATVAKAATTTGAKPTTAKP